MTGIERPDWTDTPSGGGGTLDIEELGKVTHQDMPGWAPPGVTLLKDGKIVREDWGESASSEPLDHETDDATARAELEAETPKKRPDWPLPEESAPPAETSDESPTEPADLTPAAQFATAILDEAEHSDEIVGAFDRMPSAVQVAIADELEAEVDQSAPLILEEDLEDFIGDAIGGELWEEWGDDAELRFSVLHSRFNRLRNSIPESDQQAFDDFIDGLPPASAKEALRRLAG